MTNSNTSTPTGIAGSTDAEIIHRSLDDPSAFADIHHRHFQAVRRYAASRIGPDAAFDIASETFLIAFDARTRYWPSPEQSCLPWLLGIATNQIGQHRRGEVRWLRSQEARARSIEVESRQRGAIIDPASGRDIDDLARSLDAHDLVSPLLCSLSDLSPKLREPFLLYALADLSYEETSEALGLPVGTVKSRINRARARLAATQLKETT